MSCYVQNSTKLGIIAPDLRLISESSMHCFKRGGPGKTGSRGAERATSKDRYWEGDKDSSCFLDATERTHHKLMHEWSWDLLIAHFIGK